MSKKSVFVTIPKPTEKASGQVDTHSNALSWAKPFNEMFGVPKRDCTPAAILETMQSLTEMKQSRYGSFQRKALSLEDITEHAKIRNIDCTPSAVRKCLIVLYRKKAILHRAIADNHRFLVKSSTARASVRAQPHGVFSMLDHQYQLDKAKR